MVLLSEPTKDAASAQQDQGSNSKMGRLATVQALTIT